MAIIGYQLNLNMPYSRGADERFICTDKQKAIEYFVQFCKDILEDEVVEDFDDNAYDEYTEEDVEKEVQKRLTKIQQELAARIDSDEGYQKEFNDGSNIVACSATIVE